MMEVFVDIAQDRNYQIGSIGTVKRKPHTACGPKGHARFWQEKVMSKNVGSDGYIYTSLKGISYAIHRLIAEAFIPNPENKKEVNHKNGIRSDYSIDNLEWSTPVENQIHSWEKLGRKATWSGKPGHLHHLSKPINQYDIDGNFVTQHGSLSEAGRNFNCSYGAIRNSIRDNGGYFRGYSWTYAI